MAKQPIHTSSNAIIYIVIISQVAKQPISIFCFVSGIGYYDVLVAIYFSRMYASCACFCNLIALSEQGRSYLMVRTS